MRDPTRFLPSMFLALLACVAVDAHGAGFHLQRAAIGSSAGLVTGGTMRVGYTLGQTAAGEATAGGWIENAGFWHGFAPSVVDVAPQGAALPSAFALDRCAPNPFSSATTMRFAVPAGHAATPFSIRVYDVTGRAVRVLAQGTRTPGFHATTWDGRDDQGRSQRNGIYFALMQAGSFRATRRLVLVH